MARGGRTRKRGTNLSVHIAHCAGRSAKAVMERYWSIPGSATASLPNHGLEKSSGVVHPSESVRNFAASQVVTRWATRDDKRPNCGRLPRPHLLAIRSARELPTLRSGSSAENGGVS